MKKREYLAMSSVEFSHWWFRSRRLFLRTVFSRIGLKKSDNAIIADIGAGTGGMEDFLSQYGRVIGIEPNVIGRSIAKQRHIVLHSGTATRTGLADESCEIVCFFDVLYHKDIDVTKALKEARRVLKKDGLLIVTDCAMPWLFGPHDVAFQARERFMLTTLKKQVQTAHMTPIFSRYMFFFTFPYFAGKRLYDKFFYTKNHVTDVQTVSPIVNMLVFNICRLEAYILPYVSFPWGSSLLLIAKK